jgi:hypothetical protein
MSVVTPAWSVALTGSATHAGCEPPIDEHVALKADAANCKVVSGRSPTVSVTLELPAVTGRFVVVVVVPVATT